MDEQKGGWKGEWMNGRVDVLNLFLFSQLNLQSRTTRQGDRGYRKGDVSEVK